MTERINRRKFIKNTLAATAALSLEEKALFAKPEDSSKSVWYLSPILSNGRDAFYDCFW